jgi:multiple antibiotic resistance protein
MNFQPLPFGSLAGALLIGFPALFSIINPIGSSLLFYSLTRERTHAERAQLARRIAIFSLIILLGSLWLGGYVLNFFGVSLGALRVAGGLVVSVQAWKVLTAPDTHDSTPHEAAAVATREDIAFFPLTMPLTTGPGTIAVAIALASERPANDVGLLAFFAGLSLAAAANAALVLLLYTSADRVLRLLGEAGARTVGRLAAFLLLCIGVQIMSNGAESLVRPWLAALSAHR